MPDFFKHIQRMKTDVLLKLVGEEIRTLFGGDKPFREIEVEYSDGGLLKRSVLQLAAWSLSDIAYYAIKESSDLQVHEPTTTDLRELYRGFVAWDNEKSGTELAAGDNNERLLRIIIGHSQKEFWYQQKFRIAHAFNRQVELLEKIPKRGHHTIDVDEICIQHTGLDARTYRANLLLAFAVAADRVDISHVTSDGSLEELDPCISLTNLQIVVESLTGNYESVRNSTQNENCFFAKPIIRTNRDRLLAVNVFALARKVADGTYWVLRDHFAKMKSREFTSQFGFYFEDYVESMLKLHLPEGSFWKLEPVPDESEADFLISTTNYRIVVELKSPLLNVDTRSFYPNMDALDDFLTKLQKGVEQLDSSGLRHQIEFKTTIKMLVLYEELHVSDGIVRLEVVRRVKDELSTDRNIFFCDIGEFEWIVSVLGQSEETGEKILAEKIASQDDPSAGIELSQVIPRLTDLRNTHMEEIVNHWDTYLPGLQARIEQDRATS